MKWLRWNGPVSMAGVAMALLCPVATAQTAYPQKPVKILVGFTPGGVPDIAARLLAQKWSEQWKQAVTVENRLGAGSNVAALALSQSAPDGHTLLSISSAHAIAPAIYPKLAFDPQLRSALARFRCGARGVCDDWARA